MAEKLPTGRLIKLDGRGGRQSQLSNGIGRLEIPFWRDRTPCTARG
jgi:hypothetical protein